MSSGRDFIRHGEQIWIHFLLTRLPSRWSYRHADNRLIKKIRDRLHDKRSRIHSEPGKKQLFNLICFVQAGALPGKDPATDEKKDYIPIIDVV